MQKTSSASGDTKAATSWQSRMRESASPDLRARLSEMSDAEVMTTALVAALFFGGSHEHARDLLDSPCYVPLMLSRSHFNRRLHRLAPLFQVLFAQLAEMWKQLTDESAYIIDLPLLRTGQHPHLALGSTRTRHSAATYPSKKRYFFGLRLCLLTTVTAKPGEAILAPSRMSDAEAVKRYEYGLPPGHIVEADRGYTTEDLLTEAQDIVLRPMRKKNSTRPVTPWIEYLQFHGRKMVETAGSLITQRFPKSIHAVTPQGFELKVFLFVLAYTLNCVL